MEASREGKIWSYTDPGCAQKRSSYPEGKKHQDKQTCIRLKTSKKERIQEKAQETSSDTDIQELVIANPHKTGIAFLCVSTTGPCSGDFIANCTALDKMEDCLGTKLGYLTISGGTNMTTSQLDSLISQVAVLKLPKSFCRIIFYFFGHGTDDALYFTDGNVERWHIISKFQLISPTNLNVFKIFIFDSCRIVHVPTVEAVQESSGMNVFDQISDSKAFQEASDSKAVDTDIRHAITVESSSQSQVHVPVGDLWELKRQYPASVNTLVINATGYNSQAYYRDGCGLVTHFFTELAPTQNESLHNLLIIMRQKIAHETQMEMVKNTQILVYEDSLMGIVNLLAESQGTARVVPTHVSASPCILSTNVHWKFDDKVQAQIQQFDIEILSDLHTKFPGDRMATISGLTSGTDYYVRVIAVYKDGTKAMSEWNKFTTPVRDCPSAIEIVTEYPGSPRAKIMWSFTGENSDLTQFCVVIKPDGKEESTWDTPSTKREIEVSGLLPSKTHQVSVSAVYHDGIEMKQNVQFTHSGRSCPVDIKITPDFDGSPYALVEWAFNGVMTDLSHFCVLMEAESRNIFDDRVTKNERKATLKGLHPSTEHKVSVIAVYTDEIQSFSSVDFVHNNRYHPEDIKITQEIPGSNCATVEWSFPECASSVLSLFRFSLKKEKNEVAVVEMLVAPQERRILISCLQPSTKYTVTVVAEYSDGIKRKSYMEYTHCARHSPSNIVVRVQYPGAPSARIMWSFEGKSSDLTHFHVVMQAKGEMDTHQDVSSGNKGTVVKGLVPLKTHQISVIAVYKDGTEERGHTEYLHSARVTPTFVSASPSVLSTAVHWKFDEGLETHMKKFHIAVFPDMFHDQTQVHTSPTSSRAAIISGLASGRAHTVRVIAVYYDDTTAESDAVQFTTPVHDPPSNIVVTSQYPGSPRAKVEWSFAGETSDLTHFRVMVQVDGKVLTDQEALSDNRVKEVSGMLPLKTHHISVVAVYRDGVEMKQNTNFTHGDRNYPQDISMIPDFDGSPNATVSWSIAGPSMDLSHFRVTVKAEDKGVVFLNSASNDERSIAVENLHPLTKHEVAVVAVYTDEIEKLNSIDFFHTDCCYPEEIEITQEVAGSNEARVKWSFPEGISNLACFIASLKRESDDSIVYSNSVAAVNREYVVHGLEPMMRYTVTIAAVYRDGNERKRVVEYENSYYSSPEDVNITENLVGSSQAAVEWSFPANCSDLSQFRVILRKEDCGEVVDEVVVASHERQAQIDGLKPSIKYSVTVAAEYSDGNLKQSSKEHVTCDDSMEDAIHFKMQSLSMVKKYFHFVDALELPFLQPMEVVILTSEEKLIMNDKEGISIHVPDGAVPAGKILPMEVGSAMYGRLSFPEGMEPLSPILWICPQDEIDLLKPFKITLPHMVEYKEGVTELFFLKACHNKELPINMSTELKELVVFNFEVMTHHEGIEFNERNGSVYTKNFCCVCIAGNLRRPTKRYLLHRTQPRYQNTRKFAIDYCITYDLQTCVQTFYKFCEESQLDVRCDWPEFTFDSEVQIDIALQPTSQWIVDIRSEKWKIAEDEVDFWKYKDEIIKLRLFQQQRRYPPKITVDIAEERATNTSKVNISFSGVVASRPLKDIIRLLPREGYRMAWNQYSRRNFTESGKHTPEYKSLLGNLVRITESLKAEPDRTDMLRLKFIERMWINLHSDMNASELVSLAIQRTGEDSRIFNEFVTLLSEISGMDALAKDLHDCKLQLN